MNALPKHRMTVDEFLAWAEQQPDKHFELFRGEVLKMSAEKADHARAKGVAWLALRAAIKRAARPCEAFVDGVSVRIDETTAYEPDVVVNCGPRVPGDSLYAPNPLLVVEILSPSTQRLDRVVKTADYLSVPGLEHVLVVDIERKVVHHYRRAAPGKAEVTLLRDGTLTLDPPGLSVEIASFFEDI
jgi:Uma2 family endonuclease